jgi:endoglucanase
MPNIGTPQINLLAKLCNALGVSGDEGAVRQIVLAEIKPLADEIKVDAIGNILATRWGSGQNRLRVMLAAHMDEVGLMLTADDGKGIFRFDTVGGLDLRQLVGKPVWVGKERLPGVIGAKPIHLATNSELKNTIALESLRIDIGAANEKKAKVGDRATFATSFKRIGPSLRAKALDNRLGVATLIELFKQPLPTIDLLAAFTVQEEVGLRGASVAAYAFDPDLAMVLDCTPAYDLPAFDGEENTRYNTRLDGGPAIYVADAGTLSDPRLIRHLIETADAQKIPYQIRQPGGGGTDAGAIHRQRAGIPTVSISIPGRGLHSAASLARLADWQRSLALVAAALERLEPAIFANER